MRRARVKKFWMSSMLLLFFLGGCKKKKVAQERICARIDFERIVALFPKTISDVSSLAHTSKDIMNVAIDHIGEVQACARTYQNTVLSYEQAYFQFFVNLCVLRVLSMLSSDEGMQEEAQKAVDDLQGYQVDVLSSNVTLCQAFSEYLELGSDNYKKSISVQYFLHHMMQEFDHIGVQLPVAQRVDVVCLQKEIQELAERYVSNVVHDERNIVVSRGELNGVSDEFISSLGMDDNDNYIVPINAHAFASIMENCLVETTRRSCFLLFEQRAYPHNQMILEELLHKRHALAHILGYPNFASYQLQGLMVKNPKKAEKFLWNMIKDVQPYADKDFAWITQAGLPPSVQLINGQMLKPWDIALVRAWYQKRHFDINWHEVSQYFSLQQVVPAFLQQFNRFFHIEFEPQKVEGLWATGLQCYRIRSLKHQSVLGYMFFDLYQRPLKKIAPLMPGALSTDPAIPRIAQGHMMIIPSIRDDCSISCVGSSVVMANFIAPMNDKPTLLGLGDVIVLFHEMGHALHALFGATRFTQFSGTQVVQDFMEVPSQMLEYWFDEPELLQAVGCHYQTGAHMPKDMIEKIIASLKFDRSHSMLQQLFLGMVSLRLHGNGMQGYEIQSMIEQLYKKIFKHVAYEPECHLEASFMHLVGNYGAAYYMYPWTSVIAADLFDSVRQKGIFTYATGNAYVTEVLSPGGLRSPYEMIGRFLNRPFNNHAFLKSL